MTSPPALVSSAPRTASSAGIPSRRGGRDFRRRKVRAVCDRQLRNGHRAAADLVWRKAERKRQATFHRAFEGNYRCTDYARA